MFGALCFGLIFTVPNFYGEAPAIQISPGKATVKVEFDLVKQLTNSLIVRVYPSIKSPI